MRFVGRACSETPEALGEQPLWERRVALVASNCFSGTNAVATGTKERFDRVCVRGPR